jgi:hypothetical protein
MHYRFLNEDDGPVFLGIGSFLEIMTDGLIPVEVLVNRYQHHQRSADVSELTPHSSEEPQFEVSIASGLRTS